MRNYNKRYLRNDYDNTENYNKSTDKNEGRSKLIIDEDSIYEIDLDCYEKKCKKDCE